MTIVHEALCMSGGTLTWSRMGTYFVVATTKSSCVRVASNILEYLTLVLFSTVPEIVHLSKSTRLIETSMYRRTAPAINAAAAFDTNMQHTQHKQMWNTTIQRREPSKQGLWSGASHAMGLRRPEAVHIRAAQSGHLTACRNHEAVHWKRHRDRPKPCFRDITVTAGMESYAAPP